MSSCPFRGAFPRLVFPIAPDGAVPEVEDRPIADGVRGLMPLGGTGDDAHPDAPRAAAGALLGRAP